NMMITIGIRIFHLRDNWLKPAAAIVLSSVRGRTIFHYICSLTAVLDHAGNTLANHVNDKTV
ncbi:MAG TPA: hypothetical protein VEJ88_08590, partial [Dissulfurispiraceae bacterium]|nr:hypothetical protein [Dissulfurispiraceae bacterium]